MSRRRLLPSTPVSFFLYLCFCWLQVVKSAVGYRYQLHVLLLVLVMAMIRKSWIDFKRNRKQETRLSVWVMEGDKQWMHCVGRVQLKKTMSAVVLFLSALWFLYFCHHPGNYYSLHHPTLITRGGWDVELFLSVDLLVCLCWMWFLWDVFIRKSVCASLCVLQIAVLKLDCLKIDWPLFVFLHFQNVHGNSAEWVRMECLCFSVDGASAGCPGRGGSSSTRTAGRYAMMINVLTEHTTLLYSLFQASLFLDDFHWRQQSSSSEPT